ncbi:MAG: biopolymer transporter ExbD [Bacteroidales bacterium]|jgi:biopolymer transport protein ExbD|nr:biopolymer transporter ExbD [Bacteroidales bacterium]MDD3526921.1 biopolymer transporter ExbD [Bacteroidales bacterium]MDD4177060.1 biopolymer transporter ExbD [Bacteroidales bacterium]MDD4742748.1 biopolymer transporter ExbD [Bacteroidales bacterium]MDY0334161.1 biopolymer transporter ExbD [Bacteroidales bacterium]
MARRATQEINAGSMADIAFLLLIFFLVTTTMDVDTGISRKLPPPLDPSVKPPDIRQRNIFTVLVNSRDRLAVDGEPINISELRQRTKTFMSNPQNREDLPEMTLRNIPPLGNVRVSKGVISLKNDRGTSYKMYIAVQNELAAAINELRDELAMEKFGRKYGQLISEDQIKAIQKAIPVPISEAEPEDIGEN